MQKRFLVHRCNKVKRPYRYSQNPIKTKLILDKTKMLLTSAEYIGHKTGLGFPQEFLNGIFNFGSLCQVDPPPTYKEAMTMWDDQHTRKKSSFSRQNCADILY